MAMFIPNPDGNASGPVALVLTKEEAVFLRTLLGQCAGLKPDNPGWNVWTVLFAPLRSDPSLIRGIKVDGDKA